MLKPFNSRTLLKSYHRHYQTFDIKYTVIEMVFSADNSTLLLLFIGVVTLVTIAARKLLSHDPREPPLAPQSIPIIGHMIGLSRSKFNYYVELRYAPCPITSSRDELILSPLKARKRPPRSSQCHSQARRCTS